MMRLPVLLVLLMGAPALAQVPAPLTETSSPTWWRPVEPAPVIINRPIIVRHPVVVRKVIVVRPRPHLRRRHRLRCAFLFFGCR